MLVKLKTSHFWALILPLVMRSTVWGEGVPVDENIKEFLTSQDGYYLDSLNEVGFAAGLVGFLMVFNKS